MLKIQRRANGKVIFTLSGRIEAEGIDELHRLLELEKAGSHIAFDLKDVTLVDRDAIKFLTDREADGIQIENCPPYVRKWIPRGKKTMNAHTDKQRTEEQDNGPK